MVPCIAKVFFKYNQQDATLHNLFISVKCSACFRRFLRPSSGAQNCIYENMKISEMEHMASAELFYMVNHSTETQIL